MKHIPTIRELIEAYREIATLERVKNERPSALTVCTVLASVRMVCRTLCDKGDAWLDWPITALTRRELDRFLLLSKSNGLRPVTAWAYLQSLRSVVARWTLPYYADRRWKVTPIELPVCRHRSARYTRPDRELLLRVRDWYESLEIRADKRDWLVATLMLEFAMRNGDVAKLLWSNFQTVIGPDGRRVVLCYTPHKTALSSARRVSWPVHPDIWERLVRIRAASPNRPRLITNAEDVFMRLNAELRSQKLFVGTKGLYELRKICIDHIYQKFGAEMASSISGDDIRTVTRYYADPSAVQVGGVRIVELL